MSPPGWPTATGEPVVVLADASTSVERECSSEWVRREHGDAEADPAPRSRAGDHRDPAGRPADGRRRPAARAPPRRVAAPRARRRARGAARAMSSTSAIRATPAPGRSAGSRRSHPDRCRIVAGEPARASELRSALGHAWAATGTRRRPHRVRGPAGERSPSSAPSAAAWRALQGAAPRPGGDVVDRPLPRRRAPRSRVELGRPEDEVTAGGERATSSEMVTGWSPAAHGSRRPARAHQLHAGLRPRARLRPRAGRPAARAPPSRTRSCSCRATSRTSTPSC